MIVLDASIVVELLTNEALAQTLRREVLPATEPITVPHLLDLEVTSALRSLAARGGVDSRSAQAYLTELFHFPAQRVSHLPLLGRMWELRHSFTAYDASYIALAEALAATLYTTDKKMLKGHRARIVLAES